MPTFAGWKFDMDYLRSKRPRRKLASLRRRMDYLTERIREAEKDGKTLSYDREERGAILWALSVLEPIFLEKDDEAETH